ncbi:MAG: Ig-like domain-containing protein [Pirellulaceae bacterium]|nr:Ig-like domain-containing protein [Pirellulaceae bacterium]
MADTSRHLAASGSKNHRPTPLNLEQLEARMLMSINTAEHAIDALDMFGASKAKPKAAAAVVKVAKNVAPSVARAITVTGGTTINGTTTSLSVLGRDDQSESLLTYSWRTTATPTGGSASFTTNGTNAAKSTNVTFTKPGIYDLRVTITDKSGAAVNATQRVTVRQAALTLQAGSTTIAPEGTWTTNVTRQTFTTSLAASITLLSAPSGGTSSISTSGTNTTIAFNRAGTYRFRATSGTSTLNFNVNVTQTLAGMTITPGTSSVSAGATQQFSVSGRDQFNQTMNVTPTWSTSAGTITNSGLLTAPSNGSLTVTARSGAINSTATVSVLAANGIANSQLSSLVTTLFADGSLNRTDVMQILRSTGTDGAVDATELSDLRYIVANAVNYAMPGYVQVLASNVVNSNAANATYQGNAAGNLAAGSTNSLLTILVDKWFLGTDLPTITGSGITYRTAAGTLFNGSPTLTDQKQGQLGDCYFIAALGAIAQRNPTAITNMFIDNGDGTFTVRFYTGTYSMFYAPDGTISDGFAGGTGTANYVTVNRQLASYANNTFAYSNAGLSLAGSSVPLWIALAEKAYAQWNATGKANRNGTNTFSGIEGGWMGTVNAQVLGTNGTAYYTSSSTAQTLINALNSGKAVTIGTKGTAGLGLVGSHAYTVASYNSSTQQFTLHNPWGMMHPSPLTWAQLQANCSMFSVATPFSTAIVSGGTVLRASPTVRSSLNTEAWVSMDAFSNQHSVETDLSHAQNDGQNDSQEGGLIDSLTDGPFDMQGAATPDQLYALAIDCAFDYQDLETSGHLTPEAVDVLFDQLDSLLSEALL